MPADLLSGTYSVPKAQDFYNIETGKLVTAVSTAPEMAPEPSAAKPAAKPELREKSIGATVLD